MDGKFLMACVERVLPSKGDAFYRVEVLKVTLSLHDIWRVWGLRM